MAVDMKTIRQRPDGTWEAEDYNREDWYQVDHPGEAIEALRAEVTRLRKALWEIHRVTSIDAAVLARAEAERALRLVGSLQ